MCREVPGITPATDVQTRRADDVAAITADIEARGEGDLVRDDLARMTEAQVPAAPTRQLRPPVCGSGP